MTESHIDNDDEACSSQEEEITRQCNGFTLQGNDLSCKNIEGICREVRLSQRFDLENRV